MHDNQSVNHINDTSPHWRESMIKYLIASLSTHIDKNKVLYLFGSTHADKDRLKQFLQNNNNIEIVYFRRQRFGELLSKVLFFIPHPSCFLVKLKVPGLLKDILLSFDAPSLHEIFYFDAGLEEDFLRVALKDEFCTGSDMERIIQKDSSYLIIGIDTDSLESDTGFTKRISYGRETPESMTWYL